MPVHSCSPCVTGLADILSEKRTVCIVFWQLIIHSVTDALAELAL